MIVLNEKQKDLVRGIYGKYKELNPIEIKGNLWILPEIVLQDKDYSSVFEILKECEIREVKEDEFFKEDII